MNGDLITQLIGFIALSVAVSAFQFNSRKKMLLIGVAASTIWCAHYLLLGAATGLAMNILGIGRGYLFYKVQPTQKNMWVMWLLVGITATVAAVTWQGPISLLSMTGSLCGVVAFWQKKPRTIRRLSMASSPPWFAYNLISGSYAGAVAEVLLLTSNLVGQYRFDLKSSSRRKLLRFAKPA